MPFVTCSICSCTFKAFTQLFRLSKEKEGLQLHYNDPTISNNENASPVFSIEPSLQESPIAPMSSLFVSSSEPSSVLLSESSIIGGYTSHSLSPDSSDLGEKTFSSIFTAASDSVGTRDNSEGPLVIVTPTRLFNLNATHFHENRASHSHSTLELGASAKSITPSDYVSTAYKDDSSISNVNTAVAADDSSSIEKKKYPVTPYPKFTAFSSPTTVKKLSKVPISVLAMRRGLVKSRVENIQKKLDKQERESCS
ncbi:hypothetical protein ACHAXM_007263 [Skeletonema potamos]